MINKNLKKNDKDEYIPINKGHFILSPESRNRRFHTILAKGWEEEYKEYRRLWNELPKTKEVRDYPLLIDMELSSLCNLRCPMCYTTTDSFKKKVKRQFIDLKLAKKIIDEAAGNIYALRLSLRGESTLNPHFIDIIKYAKQKGIKEVASLTHGGKMHGDYMRKVVDAGIDWLTISIDGLADNYDKIRKPNTFEMIKQYLQEIQDYKKSKGLDKPVIKVQGIWPAIRPYPTEYYNKLKDATDLVAYNPLIDYLSNDKSIVFQENFSCPQIYQRMVVQSTGHVHMCGCDEEATFFMGDTNTQTIKEIWKGAHMTGIREQHKKKDGFKKINTCLRCFYPRKTEPNEIARVGNRTIVVENYVNRSQKIGE